jgi:D-alanyl-lipoteichoic acid acyltransferase DltB (MBOAT superfamily)
LVYNSQKLKISKSITTCIKLFFYACWDWRFLFLLLFLDYLAGLKTIETPNSSLKKFWLSIIFNLGFLGVFKYYDFFAISFAKAITSLGFRINPITLNIILPVGISFYTFHGRPT